LTLSSHLSTIAVIPVFLLSIAACSTGRAEDPIWAMSLLEGDCADMTVHATANPTSDAEITEISQVQKVSCEGDHFMEVYALVPFPVGPIKTSDRNKRGTGDDSPNHEYPGPEVLTTFAREHCAQPFRSYLGRAPRTAEMVLTYLYPSASSWIAADEDPVDLGLLKHLVPPAPQAHRSIVCVVRIKSGVLDGSVRGTPTPARTSKDER
jgi:hypothetical protein